MPSFGPAAAFGSEFGRAAAFGSESLIQFIGQAIAALPEPPASLAIALSGGADSAMLAVHAALFARRQRIPLHFLHVHHGLQESADAWQAHVHDLAWHLGVPCHSLRVHVDLSHGDGMESAARQARYRAFQSLARQAGVRHILLAHHRSDQAETILLRLLRGTGPAGMAGMRPRVERDGLTYMRPWLGVERPLILSLAAAFFDLTGWRPVTDPSNADDKYTRAALRERLVPELDERWPGWQINVTRYARLSAEALQVLDETAAEDFARMDASPDKLGFSLAAWRVLSEPRQALVLRYWLSLLGQRMPGDARLSDLMRQLRNVHALGHDRQLRVKHGDVSIRCAKGRVFLSGD